MWSHNMIYFVFSKEISCNHRKTAWPGLATFPSDRKVLQLEFKCHLFEWEPFFLSFLCRLKHGDSTGRCLRFKHWSILNYQVSKNWDPAMQADFKSAGLTVKREVGQSETTPDFSRFRFSHSCFERENLKTKQWVIPLCSQPTHSPRGPTLNI